MTQLQRFHIDKPLFLGLLVLASLSLLILYSASGGNLALTLKQVVRLLIGFSVMLLVAQVRPEHLARWSPHLFIIGLLLLIAVFSIGAIAKGAQRWLNLGILNIQPSEFMKLAMPMMLIWYLSRNPLPPRFKDILVVGLILLGPTYLIYKQPDLGTALMIAASGLFVLFLAGMNWRTIIGMLAIVAASIPVVWVNLQGYQRTRILTLFDAQADPLGTGYHTIQSMIAVGSGGIYGKGWLNSSQAHLEYLPESSTDFVFAVFAEEFGLMGILLLLALYIFIVLRGFMIALYAQDMYSRLLSGSLTLTFFFYFFVNIGMVTGILPIVGVPLPLISYGGSSLVTIMAAFGVLMSIHTHRKIVQL